MARRAFSEFCERCSKSSCYPVHPVCSSSLLDRVYRIKEYLSHARLTLHAASALKTQSRQGRGIEDYLFTSVQRARKKGGDLWMRMPGSQRDPAGRDQEKDGLESFSGSGTRECSDPRFGDTGAFVIQVDRADVFLSMLHVCGICLPSKTIMD